MLNKKMFLRGQKGQVVLVVLLVMLAVGTIALSVASRSIVDVSLTKQEEEKIRAFSAAEAGIEDLLTQGLAGNLGTGMTSPAGFPVDYIYDVEEVGGGTGGYELEEALKNGEVIQVPLNGSAGEVKICWGKSGEGDSAVEISVFKSSNVERFAYNASGITDPNGFAAASGAEGDYNSCTNVDTSGASFMRIKVLYNSASLSIKPAAGSLPAQAYKARVTASEGESSAAVEVTERVQVYSPVFDYVLWSGGGISKEF